MSAFQILLTQDLEEKIGKTLRAQSPSHFEWIPMDFFQRPKNFTAILKNVDAIVARVDLTEEEYGLAPKLKLLQVPMSGFDHIDLKRARRHKVWVGNNGGANATAVAEHVFLLILALYRQFLFHLQSVKDGSFLNKKYSNLELCGKTLGIVGLGYCGKALAKRAKAFEMQVMYYDIRRDCVFEKEWGLEFQPFKTLMRKSDILSLHVPLTAKTRVMICSKSLSWMKPEAILINTSRGQVVDENVLAEVLKNQFLRGAGLDVFEKEPLPLSSPLLSLKNCILTPHCGPSFETLTRLAENMLINLKAVDTGTPPVFEAQAF
jgi:D-3-phosphoglycerate dehydrogenase